ncbi:MULTISPECIES: response regulator [unclassified Idiomarina]|jgi:two-component system KDP operon response regulator KdpE|uniref:response regulator n=1 Tax=unclassified Idiomarina TaxID=2614829 RepID=UPI00257C7C0A|nr:MULTISPECIES: response regulator transcription factor [unclassified Idiomarina]|tara:strand:- start:8065 stop:8778 length:714 start_codon:yes stop_codon:yes gene_type:complete
MNAQARTDGPRILVIDDEPQIRRFMRASLTAEGYTYLEAATAGQGIKQITSQNPHLVILDLGLPDADGYQVMRQLREWSQVPVLVLTARDDELQKVKLLEGGANDYLTKPFGIRELMARIHVLLRDLSDQQPTAEAQLRFGELLIDREQHKVFLQNEMVNLSRKEYALLDFLVSHPQKLVTQQQLLEKIWGRTHQEDTHYLRIFVSQVRKKLKDDPAQPKYIETEPGVGYRFIADKS